MPRSKLMSVTSVDLQVVLVDPFDLRIHAMGRAGTPGWSRCKLQFAGMEKGVAVYDLTAEPPAEGSIVISKSTTMEAEAHYLDDPRTVSSVRVRAAKNSLSVRRV